MNNTTVEQPQYLHQDALMNQLSFPLNDCIPVALYQTTKQTVNSEHPST